jgi:hypothetical protein
MMTILIRCVLASTSSACAARWQGRMSFGCSSTVELGQASRAAVAAAAAAAVGQESRAAATAASGLIVCVERRL